MATPTTSARKPIKQRGKATPGKIVDLAVESKRWRLKACLAAALVICANMFIACNGADRVRFAPEMKLANLEGKDIAPLNPAAEATALIFITADCPISNAYAPEINAIVDEFKDRHISIRLVHVDSALSLDEARQHAREYGFRCPVLLDPQHELATAVGATITPEAAVIDHRRRLVYRGRIDDRYVDLGKKRQAPSQRDLREALEAVLRGAKVSPSRTRAVGCLIPEPES